MSQFLLLPNDQPLLDNRLLLEFENKNVYAIPIYKTTDDYKIISKYNSIILTVLIEIFIILIIVFLYANESRIKLTRGILKPTDEILIWELL